VWLERRLSHGHAAAAAGRTDDRATMAKQTAEKDRALAAEMRVLPSAAWRLARAALGQRALLFELELHHRRERTAVELHIHGAAGIGIRLRRLPVELPVAIARILETARTRGDFLDGIQWIAREFGAADEIGQEVHEARRIRDRDIVGVREAPLGRHCLSRLDDVHEIVINRTVGRPRRPGWWATFTTGAVWWCQVLPRGSAGRVGTGASSSFHVRGAGPAQSLQFKPLDGGVPQQLLAVREGAADERPAS
jgi:hypothetical protein